MNVTATHFKNNFGKCVDAALREPVFVEKNGRRALVVIAFQDYERLQALEDAYWGEIALAAEKRGEFVEGWDALERLAKEKGIEVDAPI